jgi:predicted Ser/Thr protein kinase
VLVKDVAGMHPVIRSLYGRPVLRREARALTALDGTKGVPRFLGSIDRDALAMEFVAAETMSRRLERTRLLRACAALGERVTALHARGVVHLDLRQKRNVLVTADGDVVLIDFQSALVLGTAGWRGVVLRLLSRLDRTAVLKYRERYAPETLSELERRRARRNRWLARIWFFHRFGALLRTLLRRHSRSP